MTFKESEILLNDPQLKNIGEEDRVDDIPDDKKMLINLH